MDPHIKDVEFHCLGARLRVEGKVGLDTARIVSSAPIFANWLNVHSPRDDSDAPIWGRCQLSAYWIASWTSEIKRSASDLSFRGES